MFLRVPWTNAFTQKVFFKSPSSICISLNFQRQHHHVVVGEKMVIIVQSLQLTVLLCVFEIQKDHQST